MENIGSNTFEQIEKEPIVHTVRGAIFWQGKFLMLQKDSTSSNAGVWEFCGGKIDGLEDGEEPTSEKKEEALIREMEEETRIDLSNLKYEVIPVKSFETRHVAIRKNDKKKVLVRRMVHMYLIKFPDNVDLSIRVNEEINEQGKAEDHHAEAVFLSPEDIVNKTKNKISRRDQWGQEEKVLEISRNSRFGLKELFEVAGVKISQMQ